MVESHTKIIQGIWLVSGLLRALKVDTSVLKIPSLTFAEVSPRPSSLQDESAKLILELTR